MSETCQKCGSVAARHSTHSGECREQQLQNECDGYAAELILARAQLAEAQEREKATRETLEWYADSRNYEDEVYEWDTDAHSWNVLCTVEDKARAALAAKKEE